VTHQYIEYRSGYKYQLAVDYQTGTSIMCKEDGVLSGVAKVYYEALKALGKPSTDPKTEKPIFRAP
jgi:hypothetical protein